MGIHVVYICARNVCISYPAEVVDPIRSPNQNVLPMISTKSILEQNIPVGKARLLNGCKYTNLLITRRGPQYPNQTTNLGQDRTA